MRYSSRVWPRIGVRLAMMAVMTAAAGCQRDAAQTYAKPAVAPQKTTAQTAAANSLQTSSQPAAAKRETPAERPVTSTLADLVTAARATEFELPKIDPEAIAAAGLRKVAGEHITLYTDLPPSPEIDELPRVFDAAVPFWSEYFSIPSASVGEWKLIASVMKDKSRFVTGGLYPPSLPDFAHGYNVGSQIWLYDQTSAYYRRHLLLHEGTHAFMLRFLGGAGPPWYMEGMAELLATHRWQEGQLELAIMPRTKQEMPYWGRIKIIKDDVADGRGMSLIEVMKYDAQAHLQVEAYAWCWAAAWFLRHHPLTSAAFSDLKTSARDRTIEFSKRFYEKLKADWPAIAEDWQIFTGECDYGYDVARAAVRRKPVSDLPAEGTIVTIARDHGWQSTGFRLTAGRKYVLKASGRYTIQSGAETWPCEAGGITIHYHRGQPLGMLLGGLSELGQAGSEQSPLLAPQPIGLGAELTPSTTGTLLLKINEASGALADNSGSLTVEIKENN